MATFQHLDSLLWWGVQLFGDHRNLVFIFEPEACRGVVRLEHWRTYLGQFKFTVVHIAGTNNN